MGDDFTENFLDETNSDTVRHPPDAEGEHETPLSEPQSLALAALLNGMTQAQAAEQAGVSRRTVTRWVSHDRPFQAEFQRAREDTRQAVHARLLESAAVAAEAVARQIREGDGKLAMRLLEKLGPDGPLGPVAHRPPPAVPAAPAAPAASEDSVDQILARILGGK